MQLSAVLDVIEGLIHASHHPDIDRVHRYGRDTAPGGQSPAGVAVRWRSSGATSYLAGTTIRIEGPLPTPEQVPPPAAKTERLPALVAQLLDVAQPQQLRSWQMVALKGIGPGDRQDGTWPGGLAVVGADGSTVTLHSTYGSGQTREPEVDPHPEYRIPSEVSSWHLDRNAQSAAPA